MRLFAQARDGLRGAGQRGLPAASRDGGPRRGKARADRAIAVRFVAWPHRPAPSA